MSILKAVLPAEVMISGAQDKVCGSVAVYADQWHGTGPLGGLATYLKRMNTDLLLILAVDLAASSVPHFLEKLLSALLRVAAASSRFGRQPL